MLLKNYLGNGMISVETLGFGPGLRTDRLIGRLSDGSIRFGHNLDQPGGGQEVLIWGADGSISINLNGAVNVKSFGAKYDGTDDSAALAAAVAAVPAAGGSIVFPVGTFNYGTNPVISRSNIALIGDPSGGSILNFTGSGNALTFDGGAVVGDLFGVAVKDLTIQGNAAATNGLFLRSVHHSIFINIRFTNLSAAGLLTNYAILNSFENIRVSSNEGAFGTTPVNGILLDKRGAGESTIGNTFINPIVEGVSGSGIKLVDTQSNRFIGGASEGNARGFEISSSGTSNLNNEVFGLFIQDSTEDVLVAAGDNAFYDLSTSGTVHLTSGNAVRTKIIGGRVNTLVIDAAVSWTQVISTLIAGGTLTDNGTQTFLLGVFDGLNGVFFQNKIAMVGGSTTISTGVGSVKMSTVNAATNTAWIPIVYNGTTYYVPGWTTNAP